MNDTNTRVANNLVSVTENTHPAVNRRHNIDHGTQHRSRHTTYITAHNICHGTQHTSRYTKYITVYKIHHGTQNTSRYTTHHHVIQQTITVHNIQNTTKQIARF